MPRIPKNPNPYVAFFKVRGEISSVPFPLSREVEVIQNDRTSSLYWIPTVFQVAVTGFGVS